MEASESAPSGETVETPDIETGAEEQQEPKQDDYQSRIDSRLEEMSRTIQELAQRPQYEPPTEYEDEEDPYPLDEGDEGFEDQEALRVLDEAIERKVQERLTPHVRAQQIEKRDEALESLQEKLPELADVGKAKPYVEEAYQWAVELTGQEDPDVVNTPAFVKMIERVYKAAKADERAAQETPPQRMTSLESSGGAAPQEQEEDLQERLIRAYKESHTSI